MQNHGGNFGESLKEIASLRDGTLKTKKSSIDMLTYSERIELRGKLENGEIEIEAAIAQYWNGFKEGQRSWHTKDWQERRSKIIKDKCEICGSKDTLTLQHRSHSKKYSEYLTEVTRAYAEEYRSTNTVIDKNEFTTYVLKNYNYVPVPFCPNCKWSNPYVRMKKIPKYRCLGMSARI